MPTLSCAPLSGRYLSFAEREEIAILRAPEVGVRETARQLGRSPSTISRELRRNAATRGGRLEYRATTAQWHADRRAERPKVAKLAANQRLRSYVHQRLAGEIRRPNGIAVSGPEVRWIGRRHGRRKDRRWAHCWSPEQIAGRLSVDFPDDRGMRISHEAIYQAPFADVVHRLSAYRGVTRLGALTLASEVGDWRRFPRAAAFTGFCGLVPSEYSSGTSTRRGHITKCGNAHLRTQLAWVGLGLPAPACGRGRPAPPPAGPGSPGRRPGLGDPAAAVRPLPASGRPQRLQERGRHRDRPGTRRIPVGRDGSLTCSPANGHRLDRRQGDRQPHAAPGHRRCRTDPREYSAPATPARA